MSVGEVGTADGTAMAPHVFPREDAAPGLLVRLADYRELAKPRIALMALITVAVGYFVAGGAAEPWRLLATFAGIGLIAAASGALNQWLESDTDALMLRTADRPLPAGRLSSNSALLFGVFCAVGGTVWLLAGVNLLTAALAVATLLLYVFVYTPLKRVSSASTAIGAIPGALPPVLGWTAATGELSSGALVLFGILFLWQFPHFLAIAWLYRRQYESAGLKLLPGGGIIDGMTGWIAVVYAVLLIPTSLLAISLGLGGVGYAIVAGVLGAGYAVCSVAFALSESTKTARRLLWASLVYLPTVLIALTIDAFGVYG
ncbi:heme o synthase [Stratiformator vulcanicus]|uniref:Protoheme IX farnesyltransferase n=1 Tax=Stratiformator vulcanicus TaxID=2527980 RepID=A0A517R3Z5_9PLAN|nr:heme o synthase [Stratiformator vulcanicus]QDT38563.1 Protoheme IX farnesyltransferase 1 [Stratiformator vulcanicus]